MFIAIEGCVGAGKSTVARGLAACRGSSLLLEDFESNPFLRAFYTDPVGAAVETEFAFLLLHHHQLKLHATEMSKSEVIADFHFAKDLLYAELNLADTRARRLFHQLYDFCAETTPSPELMVCLSATTDLVLDRIRQRRREFELHINTAYYRTVNAAYEELFQRFPGKKIVLHMADWDFVKDPGLFRQLAVLVDGELSNT